jgi:hypothetical protein
MQVTVAPLMGKIARRTSQPAQKSATCLPGPIAALSPARQPPPARRNGLVGEKISGETRESTTMRRETGENLVAKMG